MQQSYSAASLGASERTRPATQASVTSFSSYKKANMLGPARGTRSMFGPSQVLSQKSSSPSFSFGSSPSRLTFTGAAARGDQTLQASVSSGGAASPGPIYNPSPVSKWLGDAPTPKFGTQEQRPATGAAAQEISKITGKSNLPGPGSYPQPASVGKQPLGRCHSFSVFSFGNQRQRESAAKATASPGPVYEPRGTKYGSMDRAAYSFGNDVRSKNRDAAIRNPGPGVYNYKSSMGSQVNSDQRSAPIASFGTPGRGDGGRGILPLEGRASPGPIYMNSQGACRRQALSSCRSGEVAAFPRAERFKQGELGSIPHPGPGEYIVRTAPRGRARGIEHPSPRAHRCMLTPRALRRTAQV